MLAYFGKKRPASGQKTSVTYGQVYKAFVDYRAAWEQYWAEPRRKRCEVQGVVLSGLEMSAIVRTHTTVKGLIASVVIILVIIAVPLSSRYYMNNIFRADKVSLVTLGMTEDEVEDVFCSSYRGQTDDMASTDLVWKYYDADYMKLLEKNDSFDPGGIGDEDDFESAFEDSVALETTSFKYIEVTFAAAETEYGTGEKTVTGVLFDADRTRESNGRDEKDIESQTVLTAEVVLGTDSINVVYEIAYEDGSLFKGAPAYAWLAFDEVADEVGGQVTVEWYDPFGTLLTATATVVAA